MIIDTHDIFQNELNKQCQYIVPWTDENDIRLAEKQHFNCQKRSISQTDNTTQYTGSNMKKMSQKVSLHKLFY